MWGISCIFSHIPTNIFPLTMENCQWDKEGDIVGQTMEAGAGGGLQGGDGDMILAWRLVAKRLIVDFKTMTNERKMKSGRVSFKAGLSDAGRNA